VKFLRHYGDSPSVQTNWTSPAGGGECQQQEQQGNRSDEDNEEHDEAATQTARREFEK
jgi:hypothetical protein